MKIRGLNKSIYIKYCRSFKFFGVKILRFLKNTNRNGFNFMPSAITGTNPVLTFLKDIKVKSGLACGCDDQSKSFETFLQTNDSIQLTSRKNDKLRTWLN